MAALAIKRWIPQLKVQVVRDPTIPVIGVGESTTPNVPTYLFEYLGIPMREFFATALPTWKMGIHFLWGKRPWFNYGFSRQLDAQLTTLPRANGYYCDEDFTCVDPTNAMMEQGKVYLRDPVSGGPKIGSMYAFHLDNRRFVAALETIARTRGIEIIDAKVQGAQRGPQGIGAVIPVVGRPVGPGAAVRVVATSVGASLAVGVGSGFEILVIAADPVDRIFEFAKPRLDDAGAAHA